MMPPPPPPPSQSTSNIFNNDKDAQARIFKTEALKTRNFILAIAVLYFVSNLIPIVIAGAFTGIFIAALLLFPAIFTGVSFIAPSQPLIAIIVAGIVVGIILIIVIAVNAGAAAWLGWVNLLIAIAFIVLGAMSANKAEQAKKLMH